MVTQIRVNPKDCLAILDLMVACGIDPYDGRSFAQCTSLALSSLIGVARKAGIIPPEDDGFQYVNRMGPFLDAKNDRRKYRYDDMLYKRASQGISVPDLTPNIKHPGQYIPQHVGVTTSANASLQMTDTDKELLAEELKVLYDITNGGGKLTPEQEQRFTYLNKLLFS